MAPKEHLQTINQAYYEQTRSSDISFEQFQKLPAEIRLYIWRYSLAHHRLLELHINLSDSNTQDPPRSRPQQQGWSARRKPLYSTTNSLGNLVSGQRSVIVKNRQVFSKLLRVNREARGAALRFYRVHFPCRFVEQWRTGKVDERLVDRTLYFNPEYDFIHIVSNATSNETVHLIHDLKAYDPRNVGILNIAMGHNFLIRLGRLPEILETPGRAAFVDTLSRLENIVWVAAGHAGRCIVPLDGFPGNRVRFNHSMPVKPITPSFDLLERDPRPVGPELTFIQSSPGDPRLWRLKWRDTLARWKVKQIHPPTERVLFAFTPVVDTISSIEAADSWLEDEERGWLECQYRPSYIYNLVKMYEKKDPPVESPDDLAKAVRPAIGFWLFPIDALGGTEGIELRGMKKVFDLSGHWPELALSRLS